MIIIYWNKTYYEDLGTKDADGFYDYAYCYYLYRFIIEDNITYVIRRYIDTPDKCAFLRTEKDNKIYFLEENPHQNMIIIKIIKFLIEIEEIKTVEYVSKKGYKIFDLEEIMKIDLQKENKVIFEKLLSE